MDHRCGTRFTLSLPVELVLADHENVAGTVVVISVTGALVETRLDLQPLSQVSLRPLGATEPESEIEACVVRSTDRGLALEWLDTACDAVLALLPARLRPPMPTAIAAGNARGPLPQDFL